MRHDRLHSVAHNFADSLASGLGFVVGYCPTYVFAEAAVNKDGFLVVDFLNGTVEGAHPEGELSTAVPLFRNAFPAFCEKHGVVAEDYRALLVRYVAGRHDNGFVVTIEDQTGRRSSREYLGVPGRRAIVLDSLGRTRPKTRQTPVD